MPELESLNLSLLNTEAPNDPPVYKAIAMDRDGIWWFIENFNWTYGEQEIDLCPVVEQQSVDEQPTEST